MVVQFGQFLDHDMAETPNHEEEGDCCSELQQDQCLPILVPENDTFYGPRNVNCLTFARSVAFCEENGGTRQQFNDLSHFVDASTVYGSEEELSKKLRSSVDGKLLVGTNQLLPKNQRGEPLAGDFRANEMPGLAAMHTLFVREHNRICDLIKNVTNDWNDENIFQNARRILIAEYQSIVYGEFLPALHGSQNLGGLELLKEGSFYDDKTNPSITNEFATASYRFGHSMIQGIIELFAMDNSGKVDEFVLHNEFLDTSRLGASKGKGLENIIMGLINQPSQTFDKDVTIQVTNFLFTDKGIDFGGDLVARNIQRGRDHGLPGFCCYYKLYQDQSFNCTEGWSERYEGFSIDDWTLLQSIYDNPSDIDLFTGGLTQKPNGDGPLTGHVFDRMIGKQSISLITQWNMIQNEVF